MKQSWSQTPERPNDCLICGSTFHTKRPASYCSPGCRDKARYERRGQAEPDLRAEWRRRRIGRDPTYRQRIRDQWLVRASKRREFINRYKLLAGCADCGYREHAVALDIDHIDGKTASIPSLRSIPAIKAEIRRHGCQVRCANCHRVRTHIVV